MGEHLVHFPIASHISSRTGIVYNVTPSAVGVIVYKVVGNRYIEKRVNLRVEHVKHSKSRQEFLERVQVNSVKSREAKEKGGELSTFVYRACMLLSISLPCSLIVFYTC